MSHDADARARFERLAGLFAEALALEAAQREDFLARIRATDPGLAGELSELLVSSERAPGDFLDSLEVDQAAALVARGQQSLPPGTRIGAYEIVGELGRGGMGVVYVARRADGQFEQQVALKLIKRGMDSDEIQRRFLTERQILAQLDHPNIARLLDGGVTDEGQPWFAMEYVTGATLLSYCDTHRLDVRDRVRMFLGVCDAVMSAHARLVVHRDLKPSNILVTDAGQPKLLDFGVAKLLDVEAGADATRLTLFGVRPITPEYAAPEQVSGGPVTTAVDVYALGVILCELLCGQQPYRVDRGDPLAIARVICETEPLRPSLLLADVPDRARRLRGDLDTIVLMALRKDPARRYRSVNALADDLRRYLDGRPVAARPDSLRYRAGKFVQRNSLGVAAGAIIAALLVAGLMATSWQARIAAAERDRARQEAAKAEQVKELIVGLFREADPAGSKGDEVTARELLESGVGRVAKDLADQPEIQAELLHTIGTVYRELGRFDRADMLLTKALERRRALWPAGHADLATTLNGLGNVKHYQGSYDEADALYVEALAMRRGLYSERHPMIAESINDLGVLRFAQGDLEGAEPLYREALAMRRETLGPGHDHTLTSEGNLAGLLYELGQYQAAIEVAAENVRGWHELRGEGHPDATYSLDLQARAHLQLGEYEAAARLFGDALAIRRNVYGETHPTVAASLNSLAALRRDLGQYEEAEALMRETLALDRQLLGDEHPYIAGDLDNLAEAIAYQDRLDEALEIFQEALALHRKSQGADHPATAACLHKYALALTRAGRAEEARPAIDESLTILAQKRGPRHAYYAAALATKGQVLHALGDTTNATATFEQALSLQREILGDVNPDLATTLVGLASVELDLAHLETAEALLREAAAIRESALPEGHWRITEVHQLLARVAQASPE